MHKNKFLLFVLAITVLNISSQEYDDDFFKSLPDDVQKELLEKTIDKENFEEPLYRAGAKISKLDKVDKEIERNVYGENFFTSYQSTFMPINEPNFDTSYVLDYGDGIKIQLIGQKDSTNIYKIARDGTISIDDVGQISISGLTLAQAISSIKLELKKVYIATESFISLQNVRDINVLIAGNAYKPGIYTMSGNSNPLHALVMAGGVNKYGSFRDIKVKRNNKIIGVIDLYDYLINGNFNNIQRLQSGDLIFVDKTHNLVTVDGAVKRPMIYELKKDETLDKAIYFANGLDIKANTKNILLDRIENGIVRRTKINKIDDMKNIMSSDRDILNISAHKFKEVEVKGAVINPGKYLMTEGDGVLEVLSRAGGYTKNAYPSAGIYKNKAAKEISKIAAQKLYNDLVQLILNQSSINPESSDISSILDLAKNINDIEPTGRVNVEFDIQKIIQNPSLNTLIQNGDEIIIPEKTNYVYIFGEVSNEGTVTYNKNATHKYYIDKQGGFLKSADLDSVYILLPNGESIKANIQKNIFMSSPQVNIEILPGSIIYIPRKISDGYLKRQAIQAYATIIGNIGVSLASLSVLKD